MNSKISDEWTESLKPNERVDNLMRRGRKIIQNKEEFCFSIDAVLLAHYPRFKPHMRVLELGTGTGVIPLIIADEVKKIVAIEISPTMANLARRNVDLNSLSEKIGIIEGDYRDLSTMGKAESFDFVLANPPYRPVGEGQMNKLTGVAMARHECSATLADVVRAASYAVRFRGRFSLVHLPERLGEIIVEFEKNNFAPKRLRMVQPKANIPPNIMLIEAVKGGAKGGLKVDASLIVHNDDGSYTDEIIKMYSERVEV